MYSYIVMPPCLPEDKASRRVVARKLKVHDHDQTRTMQPTPHTTSVCTNIAHNNKPTQLRTSFRLQRSGVRTCTCPRSDIEFGTKHARMILYIQHLPQQNSMRTRAFHGTRRHRPRRSVARKHVSEARTRAAVTYTSPPG